MAQGGSKTKRRAAQPKGGRAPAQPTGKSRLHMSSTMSRSPLLDGAAAADIVSRLAVLAVASFIAVVTPSSAPLTHAVAQLYHLGFGLGAYVTLPASCLGCLRLFRGAIYVPRASWARRRRLDFRRGRARSGAQRAQHWAFHGRYSLSRRRVRCGGFSGPSVASAAPERPGKTISLVVPHIGLVLPGLSSSASSVGDMAGLVASGAEQPVRRRRPGRQRRPWAARRVLAA